MVPGARIELATPAFSGRRSTNELPRQLNFSSLVSALSRVKLTQNLVVVQFEPARQDSGARYRDPWRQA